MKKSLLTILMLFCISFSFAQFRTTTWGMTKERVRQVENLVKERDNFDIIEYIVPMDEMNCQLLYTFAKNKLVEATYTFTPLKIYDNENIEKYIWKRTVDNLNKKYGNPVKNDENQVIWDIKDFTIRAFNLDDSDFKEKVTVTYYPPMKSQQSIL